jgi:hypothetical protein
MPDCGHPGAGCVVGNFYTCKTLGCSNGPEVKARARPLSTDVLDSWAAALVKGIAEFEQANNWQLYRVVLSDGLPYRRRPATDEVEVRLRCECSPSGKHCGSWARVTFPGVLLTHGFGVTKIVCDLLLEAARQLWTSPKGAVIELNA